MATTSEGNPTHDGISWYFCGKFYKQVQMALYITREKQPYGGNISSLSLGFFQQMPKHIKKIITFQQISTNIVSSTRKHQSPCSCTVSPTVPLAAAAQASAIVRVRPELGIQRLTSAEISGTAKHHVESGNHFHKHTHHHPATYSGKHPFFFSKICSKTKPWDCHPRNRRVQV